ERRDRDADGNIHDDLVPVEMERLHDRLANTTRERRRIGRLLDRRHDDGELVATQPRDRVGLTRAAAQAVRHHLEELVADRMAQSIVDALESVEVEAEHRQHLAAVYTLEHVLNPLA